MTKLHDGGIEARKEHQPDGQWLIAVPSGESIRAIKLLESARLLREFKPAGEKPSMLASREEQRLRSEHVLSSNIEATLASVEGILEAHVHLNLPASDPLFGQALSGAKGSASVLIVGSKDFRLSKEDVVSLVAGAAGIEPSAIAVIVAAEHRGVAEEGPHIADTAPASERAPSDMQIQNVLTRHARPLAALLTALAVGFGILLWRTRSAPLLGKLS